MMRAPMHLPSVEVSRGRPDVGARRQIRINTAATLLNMTSSHNSSRADGARRRIDGSPLTPPAGAVHRANRCSVVQRPCWRVFRRWCVSALQAREGGGLMGVR